MTEEDRQALNQAHRRTEEANANVREIMEANHRLRLSLLDAQGRAQAAHAAYTTLWASMVRKYGREEVEG